MTNMDNTINQTQTAPPPKSVDQNTNLMGQNYNLADPNQFKSYQDKINANPNLNKPDTTPPPTVPPVDQNQTNIDTAQTGMNDLNNQTTQAYNSFKQTADQYANGAIPLSAAQQAQIQGLTQQYQTLLDNQKQQNVNSGGVANIRGYQTGSAEYNPTFQTNIINSIFSAGQAKVADLSTKMASAIGQMTSGFETDNFNAVKSAYDEYTKFAKDQKDAFQKSIDDANAKIKEAQDAQKKVTDAVNAVALEAAKNGADKKTMAAISGSGNVQDAINASGGFLQTASGTLGDYLQYKRDSEAKGLTPLDYTEYKDQQDAKAEKLKNAGAYSQAYNSAAGKAAADAQFGTGGSSGGAGLPPDKQSLSTFLSGKTPEQTAAFNFLSDVDKTSVMSLIGGDVLLADLFSSRGIQGGAQRQAFLNKVSAIDPTFSENQNKQRYAFKTKWNDPNGKSYQIRTGVNTALTHLSRLKELTDGLANNGDFQKANSVSNWISQNINSDKPADPKNPKGPTVADILGQFTDTVDLLATEIARAYKGGVPDKVEIDRQIASISADKPKNIINSILNNKGTLMSGLLAAQGQEYKQTMGQYPPDSIVNPDVLKTLKESGVDTSKIEEKLANQGYTPAVEPKIEVDSFIKQNPDFTETVAKMYEVPGATDQDIYDYLKANGKIQ